MLLTWGVEIEGGWRGHPNASTIRSCLSHDGSLERLDSPYGELVSTPYRCWHQLESWLADVWPTQTNSSCGYHIHVGSLLEKEKTRLCQPGFFELFYKRLEEWGEQYPCRNRLFWSRLRGENYYCRREFYPLEQMRGLHSRYTGINFAAWSKHGTIEFRVLPTFKQVKTALAASAVVRGVVEEWLRSSD